MIEDYKTIVVQNVCKFCYHEPKFQSEQWKDWKKNGKPYIVPEGAKVYLMQHWKSDWDSKKHSMKSFNELISLGEISFEKLMDWTYNPSDIGSYREVHKCIEYEEDKIARQKFCEQLLEYLLELDELLPEKEK